MNVADTEVVLSVLHKAGYQPTTELEGADIAFMNTFIKDLQFADKFFKNIHSQEGLFAICFTLPRLTLRENNLQT